MHRKLLARKAKILLVTAGVLYVCLIIVGLVIFADQHRVNLMQQQEIHRLVRKHVVRAKLIELLINDLLVAGEPYRDPPGEHPLAKFPVLNEDDSLGPALEYAGQLMIDGRIVKKAEYEHLMTLIRQALVKDKK